MIKREILFPKRIVLREGNVEGAEHLTAPAPLQATLGNYTRPMMKIKGKASVLLDFGVETKGSLRIVCTRLSTPHNGKELGYGTARGCKIRIRFGESVSECCAELGEKGACNDHSPRDLEVLLVNMSDYTYGQSGFRFARVDFLDPDAEITIAAIAADGVVLDLPAQYCYQGDDPLVQAIFTAAKRTIDLCAAGDYVWDGIKRDRLVWIGDMHPEMLALTTLYGSTPMMENSLRLMRDTTPSDQWMCNILTYSAWWVIVLADYYILTCKEDFARENLPYAQSLVRKFLEVVTEDGELTAIGLVDWPTKGHEDEYAGAHAILQYMARKAYLLFSALEADTTAARELMDLLQKRPIEVRSSMTVVGLKYFACGKLTEGDLALLKEQGANGLSTFMSYYVLTAYADHFGADAALEIMKEYYGGMLSRGATTFWEDFHLSWLEGSGRIDQLPKQGEKDLHGDYGDHCYVGFRHSLCHAWSTGIIRFLEENDF